MIVETTYKYVMARCYDFHYDRNFYDTAFHKRRIRRNGRHKANLDMRIEVSMVDAEEKFLLDEMDKLETKIEDFLLEQEALDEYNHQLEDDDYEQRAIEWERKNFQYEEWDYYDFGYRDELDFY